LIFSPQKKDSWNRYHVPKSVRNFSIITKMEKVGNACGEEAREHDITIEEVLATEEFKNLSGLVSSFIS
jgi:hypothetical protein